VSSITIAATIDILSMATVLRNNQNSGDSIKSTSLISVCTSEPGINISILINTIIIPILKIFTALRHLYLSVMAPMAGRTSKPRNESIVKIKPTMIDE